LAFGLRATIGECGGNNKLIRKDVNENGTDLPSSAATELAWRNSEM
jgi:hypothetical protein